MTQNSRKFYRFWIWALIVLIVGLSVAGFVFMILSWDVRLPGLWGFRGIPVPFVIVNSTIGALILFHQPKNIIGWMLLSFGLLSAVDYFGEEYATYSWFISSQRLPGDQIAAWLSSWVWVLQVGPLLTLLPLLFPDGKLISSRWRPLAITSGIVMAGLTLIVALNPKLEPRAWVFSNPINLGLSPDLVARFLFISVLTGLVVSALCIISLYYRYRSGSILKRQQIKWFLFASSIAMIFAFPGYYGGLLGAMLFFFAVQGIAVSVGIAIIYYHLFDIDLIIRRTIVYGLLTILLVSIYFGIVTLLQGIFTSLTGQRSVIAIVISTLAIAGIFNPLRLRIQAIIDRRFYRRKYNTQVMLQNFAINLRNQVELEQISDDLLTVIQEILQPELLSLWLTKNDK